MSKITELEKKRMKTEVSEFSIGDTVKVYIKIIEEGKQRLQAFEGIVIGRKGAGFKETFKVRRVSYGEGVERTFLLHAPTVDKITVSRRGIVKRAKLYYLRKRVGKKITVKEKIVSSAKKA